MSEADVHFITHLEDIHSVLREGHDFGKQCVCVSDHNPNPMELNKHHIHPLGMGGADTEDNIVWLCPTSHANVHELLRAWVKNEGEPSWNVRKHFSPYVRDIAEDGYRRWVASQEF